MSWGFFLFVFFFVVFLSFCVDFFLSHGGWITSPLRKKKKKKKYKNEKKVSSSTKKKKINTETKQWNCNKVDLIPNKSHVC